MAADQFCLRWHNFQLNITSALEDLKSSEDLVDVTLTCDGHNVKAHKVILSASSPYFLKVFKENPCQHPVIILKDVNYEDFSALLHFMYHGEVMIAQERLAPFLITAELLQVKGLTGAASPFYDLKLPPPHRPLQEQLSEMRRKPTQSGQMRKLTPPLSLSPSSVPLSSPIRMQKAPRSPLTSPPLSDLSTGTASPIIREKSKESTQTVLNREPEIDLRVQADSPASLTMQGLPSSVSYSASNEQPGTSFTPLYSEQSGFSAPASPATFQQHSSDSNSSLLLVGNAMKIQTLSQPPSPPAGKRRKTFPRRVSSGQLSLDQIKSVNMSDSAGELKEEHSELGDTDTAVKVEQRSDDELDNEQDEDHESSAFAQESMADADVDGGGFSTQMTGDKESQIVEEQGVADEMGEVGSISSNQSMLLRSLSGQPPGMIQGDGSPSARSGTTGKMATLPHVPQCGTCPHCGQTYSNQSALKYHVRLMHTDMTNRHCCHLCPRSFALRDVFKAHMWSKHKQRC